MNNPNSISARAGLARLVLSLALLATIASAFQPVAARQEPDVAPPVEGVFTGESTPAQFDVSPPLRDIPPLAPAELPEGERDLPELASGLEGPTGPQDSDAAVQDQIGQGEIAAPVISFDSLNNISGVTPPDPVGDVGPNHYVAMSNLSFQIYNKSGISLYGPALNNTLWAGFGGDCQTDNSGDPIVLYDQLADRWILSQFTASGPTYFVCLAVSTTGDPTGNYYRYAIPTGVNFPDYPKLAVWPDAIYISTRDFANGAAFTGIGAYAVNRAQVLAGNPAAQTISFLVTPASAGGTYNIGDGLLPADLDGSAPPPPGSPGYFMGVMDNGGPYGAPQDALTLWKFTADFATPANSSFILANTLPVAAFDSIFPCTPTSRHCIPQPGTPNTLDILSYRQRLMHRLAYRNFGTHESLVTNHSVEALANQAGIRWYEVRSPNSNPVVYQEGTFSPGDGRHRWMGSAAMDRSGNIALGYSISDGVSTYPGVRYTGRLTSDPLGTLPQGEGVIINGTGSQTGSQRWGDYTSMNVDPVDDCTFWYVNQYIPTTSSNGWRLRVGSFQLQNCASADISLVKSSASTVVNPGAPISYQLAATNHGPSVSGGASIIATNQIITIPSSGSATPYPATITIPATTATLLKVTVTLSGINHTYSDDIDVLLVGPGGQKAMLMSDVGGITDMINVNLTFDDAAVATLPDSGGIGSGTFKPTDFEPDNFLAPAPGGPFTASLAVFNGTNPSGTWQLFVQDDFVGDSGSINGGWSIQFYLNGVTLTDTLPAGVTYNGFSGTNWSCSPNGQVITCTYGPSLLGAAPVLTLNATAPSTPGLIDNQATVVGMVYDPDPSDNASSFAILVPWRAILPLVVR